MFLFKVKGKRFIRGLKRNQSDNFHMHGSRNFHQGGPGPSDIKKALTTVFMPPPFIMGGGDI